MRGVLVILILFCLQLAIPIGSIVANAPCGMPGTMVSGKGSAYPTALFVTWSRDYCATTPTTKIEYESYNSNGGARGLFNTTPTHIFAGVGEPADDISFFTADPGKLARIYQIPTSLTAVAYVYNLTGTNQQRLSGVRIGINELRRAFGTNTTIDWNNPLIVASNLESVRRFLPAVPLEVACRPDGEDIDIQALHNAFILATNTTISSPQLGAGCTNSKERLETDDSVRRWVNEKSGRIGIVDYRYALQQQLPMLAICRGKTRGDTSDKCVSPSEETMQLATNTPVFNPLPVWPTNQNWYPAVGYSWTIFRNDLTAPADKVRITELTRFLFWALSTQDSTTRQQNYVPLPANAKAYALGQLCRVHIDGNRVITQGCPN